MVERVEKLRKLLAIYEITRSGFLRKIRRYRFLVILVLCIVGGYIFVPAQDANYVTFGWSSPMAFYRGSYNSAWIGALVTLLTSILLSLFGFYVVNDTVKLDIKTRVGQIIATTPVGNWFYILGNALSNFMVLSTMVLIIFLTALGMQLVRGEVQTIDVLPLIAPFLIFVLPVMAVVAALAILFETIPLLQKRLGNIVFVVLWIIGIPIISERIDLFGIETIRSSIAVAGFTRYPEMAKSTFVLGFNTGLSQKQVLTTFAWQGIQWSLEILQTRLLLICLAFAITFIASWRFNRFDPSNETNNTTEGIPREEYGLDEAYTSSKTHQYSEIMPLDNRAIGFGFGSILLAELKLVLREFPSVNRIWFLITAALIIAGSLLPINLVRSIVLPIAWFLPILYWSKLGTYENRYGTSHLVFSSANVFKRQLLAIWLTGIFVSVLTGVGVALNMLLHGELSAVVAWGVGALFIPSMALCLGVWTGSGKVFEFLYTLFWYIGPLSGVEPLDFMGASPSSVETGIWQLYLALTLILIGLTYLGRSLQIRRE